MSDHPLANLRQRCLDQISNEIRSNAFNYTPAHIPSEFEAECEALRRIDAMSNLDLLTLIESLAHG